MESQANKLTHRALRRFLRKYSDGCPTKFLIQYTYFKKEIFEIR